MTAGGLLRAVVPAADGVRQIAVPAGARARSTLAGVDYSDAFLIQTGPTEIRTPDQWARAIFDDAPIAIRTSLLAGWSVLGLKLASPGSNEHVLGWRIHQSTPDFVLLRADGRLGLSGELLVELQPEELLFCTFVQLSNPAARTIWAGVEPMHEQVVPRVLTHVAA